MTFREKLNTTKDWKKRIHIINLYHKMKCLKSKWLIADTARYFKISIGSTSEAIKLAENIELVRDCTSRKQALLRIK